MQNFNDYGQYIRSRYTDHPPHFALLRILGQLSSLHERLHQRFLRNINIHWSDFISNVRTGGDHVVEGETMLDRLCFQGKRPTSIQDIVNSPLDTVTAKESPQNSHCTSYIDYGQWSKLVAKQKTWRLTLYRTVYNFESKRRAELTNKKKREKKPHQMYMR